MIQCFELLQTDNNLMVWNNEYNFHSNLTETYRVKASAFLCSYTYRHTVEPCQAEIAQYFCKKNLLFIHSVSMQRHKQYTVIVIENNKKEHRRNYIYIKRRSRGCCLMSQQTQPGQLMGQLGSVQTISITFTIMSIPFYRLIFCQEQKQRNAASNSARSLSGLDQPSWIGLLTVFKNCIVKYKQTFSISISCAALAKSPKHPFTRTTQKQESRTEASLRRSTTFSSVLHQHLLVGLRWALGSLCNYSRCFETQQRCYSSRTVLLPAGLYAHCCLLTLQPPGLSEILKPLTVKCSFA